MQDDDDFSKSYEREKRVGLLILKAFIKCGLEVTEHDNRHSGVKLNDHTSYDILYSDNDHEAIVHLDEANLAGLLKLEKSGLIDGDCNIIATGDRTLMLTFKVSPMLHDGNAKFNEMKKFQLLKDIILHESGERG